MTKMCIDLIHFLFKEKSEILLKVNSLAGKVEYNPYSYSKKHRVEVY